MKNISMPRLGISLWFANYSVLSLISYFGGGGRLQIFNMIVLATVFLAIEIIGFGLLNDLEEK